jgi:hypothetical protein
MITTSIGDSDAVVPDGNGAEKLIGPLCNVRVVQVPVKLANITVTGAALTVAVTFPAVPVSCPLIIPVAVITPFVSVKALVVNIPVKVPSPAITCIMAVPAEVIGGGACAGTGAVISPIDRATIINTAMPLK